jgi:hypothetical protein
LVDPVFVAEKVGVIPDTGLLETSRSVIVTVEAELPSATTGPEPVIVELAAETELAMNVTVFESVLSAAGDVMLTVFVSATVEERVATNCPKAFVTPEEGVRLAPKPLALRVTEMPGRTAALESRTVTVIVDVLAPSAAIPEAGETESVEVALDALPPPPRSDSV